MGSKPPDPAPGQSATKRGRFDTTNSPTMVYVRRKIDHDQQNKPCPSSETSKNSGGESAKEPNLGLNEEKKEPDLECHEPNVEGDLNDMKDSAPNLVENKENDSILEPTGNKIESHSDAELCLMKVSEPDLECHEPNVEAELNELKDAGPNLVGNRESGSILEVNGNKIESHSDAELCQVNIGALTARPAEVATDPESEVVIPTEVANEEKESTSGPNEEKNEPDLVCHETNIDSDLVELHAISTNQVTSLGVDEKEIEPKIDVDFQQQKSAAPNQGTNGAKNQNIGINEPKSATITSKQAMTDSNSRSSDRENFRERFAKLQIFLKDCDCSRQDDYIRMLRSLSAVGRSKHAIALEKRAMDLLMEEGKELRRMNNLHVLGKDWLKDKLSLPAQTNFHRQL
ncbi:hypothetical protein LUZ61_014939 [Rhynchospora tenuis]|uniref:Uncharacterized protein n=1 Tax=Rhynchospora tenuis TaxID=198213 RepID=A0AAD5Z1M7_9POAL|nr:hypothetical protein LUZ61_014939 [Rhynchospora tenuis]